MRRNTHLPSRDYIEPIDLGETLLDELEDLAADALHVGTEHVEVSLFCRKGKTSSEGDEDDNYGYEILLRGDHRQVDEGFDSALQAILGFDAWCEEQLEREGRSGDETDEDDED